MWIYIYQNIQYITIYMSWKWPGRLGWPGGRLVVLVIILIVINRLVDCPDRHGIIMFLQFLFVCRILILGYNISGIVRWYGASIWCTREKGVLSGRVLLQLVYMIGCYTIALLVNRNEKIVITNLLWWNVFLSVSTHRHPTSTHNTALVMQQKG
jgi:hypothetical protein